MPVHEKQATLKNTKRKKGLAGGIGGRVELANSSNKKNTQYALGNVAQPTKWNSPTGVNEVQRLTPGGTVSGGTFTITYSGQTTAAIAWNAAAGDVEDALIALSNLDPGDVRVTGGPLPGAVVDLTFGSQLASTDVGQVTTDVTNLTGAGAAMAPSTVTAGVP